jgi:type IV pilus assembly protein PilE
MAGEFKSNLKPLAKALGGRPHQRGITLIELMVTVVIVGILAMIGYPSYQEHVRKSRRADAKTALLDLAARQELFFNDHKTYTNDVTKLKASATSRDGYYNITIPVATATGYELVATAAGVQVNDSKCASFKLTATGAKSSTPAGNSCW